MEWKYDKVIPNNKFIRDRDKTELQQFMEKDKEIKARKRKEKRTKNKDGLKGTL